MKPAGSVWMKIFCGAVSRMFVFSVFVESGGVPVHILEMTFSPLTVGGMFLYRVSKVLQNKISEERGIIPRSSES